MKKMLIGAMCLTMASLYSCKKDEATTPTPTPSVNNNVNIVIKDGEIGAADGNGSFAVTHSNHSFIDENGDVTFDFDSYVAFGAFYNAIPVTSYVDGGNVILNSTDTLTNTMGLYSLNSTTNFISGGNTWKVTGNSANNVPAFTYTSGSTFPSFSLWDTKGSYTKATGVTITVPTNFIATDTAVFVIASYIDQTKKVVKVVSPGIKTYTFSATELASIPTGEITIQLTALKTYVNVTSGKKYYFFNQYQRTANSILN